MAEKFDHMVLIVDDEEQVGKALGRLLKSLAIKYVFMDSGEAGLERIKASEKEFSLIISDQRMPNMEGTEFLEKAKELTPDTIRFLLTGYSDVNAITEAVNKGSIHRYIAKPWDNKLFSEMIKTGLSQFELIKENERLFKLAKEQSAKLFALNTDLKKSSAAHQKAIAQLNGEIDDLNKRLDRGFENRNYVNEIEALLSEKNMLDEDTVNSLYLAIIGELFQQFEDIAARNGFEMPEKVLGD